MSKDRIKGKEEILSEESAQAQLDLLFDRYGFSIVDIEDENTLGVVKQQNNKIRRFIQKGRLEIKIGENNRLQVIQHLVMTDYKNLTSPIIYRSLGTKAMQAVDESGNPNTWEKMHAVLKALSGLGDLEFNELIEEDASVAHALGMLFFQL